MKTSHLQFLISFIALAATCTSASADWQVHPATEFNEEERVWASAKKGQIFRGLEN